MDKQKTFELTKSQKFFKFFTDNALNLIIVIVALVYPLRRLGYIEVSSKTLFEILADITLSVIVGSFISILLHKNGMIKGKGTEVYLYTLDRYGGKVEEASPFIEDVDPFCEWKNAQIKEANQRRLLMGVGLSFDRFKNGDYKSNKNNKKLLKLNRKQRKTIKEIYRLKDYGLNGVTLLSDCSSTITVAKLSEDEATYTRKITAKIPASKILFGVIFGYFALKFYEALDAREILWGAIEMLTYLLAGMMQRQKGFDYITISKRNNMVLKMNYLDEFLNLRKTRPEIFKPKSPPEPEKVAQSTTTVPRVSYDKMQNSISPII